jgi:hypothetical protein
MRIVMEFHPVKTLVFLDVRQKPFCLIYDLTSGSRDDVMQDVWGNVRDEVEGNTLTYFSVGDFVRQAMRQ